ncbi:predicted protein [Uncinocarpus reesii 1704]|uniref:Uncharacterized protein n=1 Tax=Uncinocarpus reesii (strain UAMH 1704) TaxID=336963 RepID=C4JVD8_UNCRE|nr:uncharacterized protein UREG_06530 [Uncinocarpus reesii 1704]EEP81665.1 predicted protein [Uncinocarpus reesii 1704]
MAGVERVVSIYNNNQQPQTIPPMKLVIYDDLPSPNDAYPPSLSMSKWITEGRDLASKSNTRKSLLSRTMTRNRRSKIRSISAPTNFRRVTQPTNRRLSFRPLELSIYAPGNHLPDLPEFSDFDLDGPQVPPRAIWSPTFKSHHRRYSDTPSTFSVPRKPVGSPRTRLSSIGDQDDFLGHRSTLSDSGLSQRMASSSISRINSRRGALHSRTQSSPVTSPLSPTKPNFNETTPSLGHANSLYSPAPSSPFTSKRRTYDKRSARSAAPPFFSYHVTAASRRSHSLASSMTSASTLYQPSPFTQLNDKEYEFAIDQVLKSRTQAPRCDEVYPTIYESEQYHFSPSSPNSPTRIFIFDTQYPRRACYVLFGFDSGGMKMDILLYGG